MYFRTREPPTSSLDCRRIVAIFTLLPKILMSLRKEFSSLRKRHSCGVQPRNLLGSSPHKITIPTEKTLNLGTLFIVHPISADIEERAQDIRTCFFLHIAIRDSGLNEKPLIVLNLDRIDYNGTSVIGNDLQLRVSKNSEFIFFTKGNAFIDKMVIPKNAMHKLLFGTNSMLIILQKKFGFFHTDYSDDDSALLEFFHTTQKHWGTEHPISRTERLEEMYQMEATNRRNSQKDPQTLVHVPNSPETDTSDASDDVLRSGLPSVPTPTKLIDGRKTRALAKSLTSDPDLMFHADTTVPIEVDGNEKPADNEEPIIQEMPAAFEPPLKQPLTNGKKFVVAYNDFKTLYNNDWINDTLIDFFIAYEIDRATNEHHLVRDNEVYAFNSFFFTKLMSKPDEQETPNYYENIKRWLGKLDLMSHESVIIPINEHLHWYCCVIRNLPELLRVARQKALQKMRALRAEQKDPRVRAETAEAEPVVPICEIYVVDSLRQKHENIEGPLRTVITEYCKEKYDIEIPQELFGFVTARVPLQRNFNDCGIHVIYNVKRWLSEPPTCEKVWSTPGKVRKGYFNGLERNTLRKTLIDLLLDLHVKQPLEDNSSSSKGTDDAQSDDEIELISYYSSKPETQDTKQDETAPMTQNEKTEEEKADGVANVVTKEGPPHESQPVAESQTHEDSSNSHTVSPDSGQAVPRVNELVTFKSLRENNTEEIEDEEMDSTRESVTTPIRTLDPRANSSSQQSHSRIFQIEHPQIRRLCMKTRLKAHTVAFLNGFFHNHSKKYDDEQRKVISEFVQNFNFFDPKVEVMQSELLTKTFKQALKQPTAPMEEPFAIQEADDSGGELNRSVGELRIAAEPRGRRLKHGNTPEATRLFLKELSSPLRKENTDIARVSRSRTKKMHENDDNDSDLEILDDEIQVLDEIRPTLLDAKSSPLETSHIEKEESGPEVVTIPDEVITAKHPVSPFFEKSTRRPKRRKMEDKLRRAY